MSRKSISARHRAATTHSIALEGLTQSAKTNAVALGKPAIIAVATGSLVFSVGATAHAGTYTQGEATTASAVSAPAASGVHTVAAGDTLGAIAAQNGINLDTLLAQNGLSYASVIYPGQQIQLTGGAAVSAAAVPAATASQAFYSAPAPVAPAAAPAVQAAAPAPAAAPVSAEPAMMTLASSPITPIASAAKAAPSVSASGVGAALVASAYGQIGSIQDCTVLVERALRSIGLNVGDLGPSQFAQYGSVVSSPAPGDLVINAGHIAIYVGGGKVISSGMNGANLTMEHPLSDLAGSYFVRVNG
ncbi:LysM repeat protein [Arthrobacter sp. CAN_A212]|uniref:C40 family peptidase n=1 Tax=Arthrobacter sp. CAN_A212 TaxID=2787719 RepID=UPI0018C99A2C